MRPTDSLAPLTEPRLLDVVGVESWDDYDPPTAWSCAPASGFPFVVGFTDTGEPLWADFTRPECGYRPNLSIEGSPASRDPLLMAALCSLAMSYGPDRMAFVLLRNGPAHTCESDVVMLPHTVAVSGIGVEPEHQLGSDSEDVVASVRREIIDRAALLSGHGCHDVASYDELRESEPGILPPMPRLCVVVQSVYSWVRDSQTSAKPSSSRERFLTEVARSSRFGVHLIAADTRMRRDWLAAAPEFGTALVAMTGGWPVPDYFPAVLGADFHDPTSAVLVRRGQRVEQPRNPLKFPFRSPDSRNRRDSATAFRFGDPSYSEPMRWPMTASSEIMWRILETTTPVVPRARWLKDQSSEFPAALRCDR